MNELLMKLLATEVLTEEAKTELQEALEKELNDAKVVAVAEAVAEEERRFAVVEA